MRKYVTEGIGTFLLVFVGTLVVTQSSGNTVVIALGFGVTLFLIITLFGPVYSVHVNPAVSFGAWLSGRLSTHDIVPYWIAQFTGAILASILVRFIVGGEGSLGETIFTVAPRTAFLLETALTFLFVMVILKAEKFKQPAFVIGGALFLIHLVAIPLTGASVNPARSIAPVVVGADPIAAAQIWVYTTGPFLGGMFAGLLMKYVGVRGAKI